MTKPKTAYALTARPRSYPTAEECAAEFNVTVPTWMRWIGQGTAPPAIPSSPPDMPRWRWSDVDDWFANPSARSMILTRYGRGELARASGADNVIDPFVAAAGKLCDGPPQGKRRGRSAH